MTCCLNPECPKPLNPDTHKYCQQCGTALNPLLHKHYKIVQPLGAGRWGKTYLAEDIDQFNTPCIVKQLTLKTLGRSPDAVQLFRNEAQQLQTLGHHPQLPDLLAYFQAGEALYLVHQWIEGQTLLDQLQQNIFSETQVRRFLMDLLPVLQVVHDQGVVHRDLKPENILQDIHGHYILIDFGIAQFLNESQAAQRPTSSQSLGYRPPEQLRGQASAVSDLFGLGATCFHLLSGVSPSELAQVHGPDWTQHWPFELVSACGPELKAILKKLLMLNPRQRYQSAQAVLEDLKGPAPTRLGLKRCQLWIGAGIVLAIAGGGGLISQLALQPPVSQSPNKNATASAPSLIHQAQVHVSQQEYKAAIATYTAALQHNPQNSAVYCQRGFAKLQLQDAEGAIQDCTQTLRQQPSSSFAYHTRGQAKQLLEQYEKAIADYTQALTIDASWGDQDSPAEGYYNRGNAKRKLGKIGGAIEDLETAAELFQQQGETEQYHLTLDLLNTL